MLLQLQLKPETMELKLLLQLETKAELRVEAGGFCYIHGVVIAFVLTLQPPQIPADCDVPWPGNNTKAKLLGSFSAAPARPVLSDPRLKNCPSVHAVSVA